MNPNASLKSRNVNCLEMASRGTEEVPVSVCHALFFTNGSSHFLRSWAVRVESNCFMLELTGDCDEISKVLGTSWPRSIIISFFWTEKSTSSNNGKTGRSAAQTGCCRRFWLLHTRHCSACDSSSSQYLLTKTFFRGVWPGIHLYPLFPVLSLHDPSTCCHGRETQPQQ